MKSYLPKKNLSGTQLFILELSKTSRFLAHLISCFQIPISAFIGLVIIAVTLIVLITCIYRPALRVSARFNVVTETVKPFTIS